MRKELVSVGEISLGLSDFMLGKIHNFYFETIPSNEQKLEFVIFAQILLRKELKNKFTKDTVNNIMGHIHVLIREFIIRNAIKLPIDYGSFIEEREEFYFSVIIPVIRRHHSGAIGAT